MLYTYLKYVNDSSVIFISKRYRVEYLKRNNVSDQYLLHIVDMNDTETIKLLSGRLRDSQTYIILTRMLIMKGTKIEYSLKTSVSHRLLSLQRDRSMSVNYYSRKKDTINFITYDDVFDNHIFKIIKDRVNRGEVKISTKVILYYLYLGEREKAEHLMSSELRHILTKRKISRSCEEFNDIVTYLMHCEKSRYRSLTKRDTRFYSLAFCNIYEMMTVVNKIRSRNFKDIISTCESISNGMSFFVNFMSMMINDKAIKGEDIVYIIIPELLKFANVVELLCIAENIKHKRERDNVIRYLRLHDAYIHAHLKYDEMSILRLNRTYTL